MKLQLERRGQEDKTVKLGDIGLATPPIDEDYWAYRVRLSETQAIVGFPKFNTIGIGFAVEEDWNTNLPYTSQAMDIFGHISHNKGDDLITDDACIKAIRMIQDAIKEDRGYTVTVQFTVPADSKETAGNLVHYELAARQEYAVESVLTDFAVKKVD